LEENEEISFIFIKSRKENFHIKEERSSMVHHKFRGAIGLKGDLEKNRGKHYLVMIN
jgi:hypothetical protein